MKDKDKDRIILLQKKLSIARAALKNIEYNGDDSYSRHVAEEAEERIEQIEMLKGA
jgi:hypothetical protein